MIGSLMGVILWGFFFEKMHPYPDALRIMSGKSEGRCNSYGSKKIIFFEIFAILDEKTVLIG